jgi:hypothetical protein
MLALGAFGRRVGTSFSKVGAGGPPRTGEEEGARHRGAIMAEQRKRLAFTRRDWRTSWA